MRIAICWATISGYMASCWQALNRVPEVELFVMAYASGSRNGETAFRSEIMSGLQHTLLDSDTTISYDEISSQLFDFRPEIIVIPGWLYPHFLRLLHDDRFDKVRFVMTSDTPWWGTLRQYLAPLKLRRHLRRISAVVVPGERAWQRAWRLGFRQNQIFRGLYGIDFESLRQTADVRSKLPYWPQKFIFIGRYSEEKALDILISAYKRYRQLSAKPWSLTCCGRGPLAKLLKNVDGITDLGFQQPSAMSAILAEHGAFVLASRFDPWPLVIVEACGAGLPVICTEACGSAVELVRPYYNGITVATENAESLTDAMLWMERQEDQFLTMSQRSQQLSAPYSANEWARRWTIMCSKIANRSAALN